MSIQDDPVFKARLQALSDKYALTIPATLAQLQAARDAIVPAKPDPEALTQVYHTLHGIAGSAATFGFASFGQHARQIEHVLIELRDSTKASEAEWSAWLASLDTYLAWAANDPRAPYPV